jgi:hypothetical protein
MTMAFRDTPRWVRTEQALRMALGCTAEPAGPVSAVYRMLAEPTFHSPCCVQITEKDGIGHVRLAVLPDSAHTLRSLVWAGAPDEALEDAILAAMLTAVAFEAPLPLDLAQVGQRPTPTVDPHDEAARDGLSLRLELLDERPHATVRTQLTGVRHSPSLAAWIAFFVDVGQAVGAPPQVHAALGHVLLYLS